MGKEINCKCEDNEREKRLIPRREDNERPKENNKL